jgi:arylsulfatase A-like enzyme
MNQPNLIFLMTNQEGADTVEAGSPCQTPNLVSLAEAGTQFHRCNAANCETWSPIQDWDA